MRWCALAKTEETIRARWLPHWCAGPRPLYAWMSTPPLYPTGSATRSVCLRRRGYATNAMSWGNLWQASVGRLSKMADLHHLLALSAFSKSHSEGISVKAICGILRLHCVWWHRRSNSSFSIVNPSSRPSKCLLQRSLRSSIDNTSFPCSSLIVTIALALFLLFFPITPSALRRWNVCEGGALSASSAISWQYLFLSSRSCRFSCRLCLRNCSLSAISARTSKLPVEPFSTHSQITPLSLQSIECSRQIIVLDYIMSVVQAPADSLPLCP